MQGRNCHYSLVKGLVRTTATKEPRRKQESTGQGQNEKSNKNTAVTNTPAHEAQHLHLLTTARHEYVTRQLLASCLKTRKGKEHCSRPPT